MKTSLIQRNHALVYLAASLGLSFQAVFPSSPLLGQAVATAPDAATYAASHAGRTPGMDTPPPLLKGDVHLQYFFEDAGETMPYRLYVPTTWDGKSQLPMIVILHGGGNDENSTFKAAHGELQEQAEKRGYVILAPFGYRNMGMYGSTLGLPPSQHATIHPAIDNTRELSEKDVMNTIAITEKQYPIDTRRVFMMGSSMGSIGIFHLVMQYPGRWPAVSVSDGPPNPAALDYDKFKGTVIRDIHGDHDELAPLQASQEIVETMKKHGVQADLIVVKDGTHTSAWVSELNATFDFFDRQSARIQGR